MNPLLLFYSGQQYRRSDWFNKKKKNRNMMMIITIKILFGSIKLNWKKKADAGWKIFTPFLHELNTGNY